MTRVYYADRPSETEIKYLPERAMVYIREDITEEEEGFSANEFESIHPKDIVVTAELITKIKAADYDKTAKEVRTKRRELLEESDRRMVSDFPCDKTVWGNYRQALRDITEQSGFPYNITWPTKPED